MKLSLWDLKPGDIAKSFTAAMIMKLSLWDLKQDYLAYLNGEQLHHEVVPMGFETD